MRCSWTILLQALVRKTYAQCRLTDTASGDPAIAFLAWATAQANDSGGLWRRSEKEDEGNEHNRWVDEHVYQPIPSNDEGRMENMKAAIK